MAEHTAMQTLADFWVLGSLQHMRLEECTHQQECALIRKTRGFNPVSRHRYFHGEDYTWFTPHQRTFQPKMMNSYLFSARHTESTCISGAHTPVETCLRNCISTSGLFSVRIYICIDTHVCKIISAGMLVPLHHPMTPSLCPCAV
jgi:hypothetical protein